MCVEKGADIELDHDSEQSFPARQKTEYREQTFTAFGTTHTDAFCAGSAGYQSWRGLWIKTADENGKNLTYNTIRINRRKKAPVFLWRAPGFDLPPVDGRQLWQVGASRLL